MNFKLIITIFLLTCSEKFVENQSCLDWTDWITFRADYDFTFDNSTIELIALSLY
jgi:hypothetical protein